MERKKIILISVAIIVMAVILWRSLSHNNNTATPEPPPTTLPQPAKEITDEATFFPKLINNDQEIIYLAGTEQTLKKMSLTTREIIDTYPLDVPYITDLVWADNGQLVIIKTIDDEKNIEQIYTYNLITKKLQFINSKIITAIWDEGRLIYCFANSQATTLGTSDWDGQNSRIIGKLQSCDEMIYYNNQKNQLVYLVYDDAMSANLMVADFQTLKETNLVSRFREGKISPNNTKILLTTAQNNNEIASIIDLTDLSIKQLNLTVELPTLAWIDEENIAWSEKDDSQKNDIFYQASINNSKKQTINYNSELSVKAEGLVASKDKRSLYFKNNYNDHIYQLARP